MHRQERNRFRAGSAIAVVTVAALTACGGGGGGGSSGSTTEAAATTQTAATSATSATSGPSSAVPVAVYYGGNADPAASVLVYLGQQVSLAPAAPDAASDALLTQAAFTPSLPAGLRVDAATGVISGTVTEPFPDTVHTLQGSLVRGTSSLRAQGSLRLQVRPPFELTYPAMAVRLNQPFTTAAPQRRMVSPQPLSAEPRALYALRAGCAIAGTVTLDAATGVLTGQAPVAPGDTCKVEVTLSSGGATWAQLIPVTLTITP